MTDHQGESIHIVDVIQRMTSLRLFSASKSRPEEGVLVQLPTGGGYFKGGSPLNAISSWSTDNGGRSYSTQTVIVTTNEGLLDIGGAYLSDRIGRNVIYSVRETPLDAAGKGKFVFVKFTLMPPTVLSSIWIPEECPEIQQALKETRHISPKYILKLKD